MNKKIFSIFKMLIVFCLGVIISFLIQSGEIIPTIVLLTGAVVWVFVFYQYEKDLNRLLGIVDKYYALMEDIKKYFGYSDSNSAVELGNIKKDNILSKLLLFDAQSGINKEVVFEIDGVEYSASIRARGNKYEK